MTPPYHGPERRHLAQAAAPSRTRWLLGFTAFAVLLGLIAAAHINAETGRQRDETLARLAEIGSYRAAQIGAWRHGRLADAHRLADDPLLRRELKALREGSASAVPVVEERLRAELAAGRYADVQLLSAEGASLAAADQPAGAIAEASQRALALAAADTAPVLSDFFTDSSGMVWVDAVVALRDPQGELLMLALLRSDARIELAPLAQQWPGKRQPVRTELMQRNGNWAQPLTGQLAGTQVPLSDLEAVAAQAVNGQVGPALGLDSRGRRVLADLRPVTGTPWFLVTSADEEQLRSDALNRAGFEIAVGSAVVLLVGGIGSLLYRRRQTALLRSLLAIEREQRLSDEIYRTTLYSIGDAVITTDPEGRVRTMNPEAARLTGWAEAQARGCPLREVFHVVDPHTRELAPDPVQAVLGCGVAIGLANDSVLIARDRSECPIADSAAPIRDESGKLLGVVLVFSDFSEAHRMRSELAASQALQRSIVDSLAEHIAVLDTNGRIVAVNEAWRRVAIANQSSTEVAEGVGLDYLAACMSTATAPDGAPAAQAEAGVRAVLAGALPAFELEYACGAQDPPRWFRMCATPLQGKRRGAVIAHENISQRKHAEAVLALRELHYRRLFEGNPHPMWVYDPATLRFLGVNDAALAQYGYTREEFLGLTLDSIRPPEDVPLLRAKLTALVSEGRARGPEIWRHKRSDNSLIEVEVHSQTLREAGAESRLVLALDVTARLAAERALRASEARFKQVVQALPAAVYTCDAQGRITMYNEAAAQLWGCRPDIGSCLTEGSWNVLTLDGEPLQPMDRPLAYTLREGAPAPRHEILLQRADGSRDIVLPHPIPIFDESGHLTGAVNMILELTERHEMEKALRRSLAEKNALLKEVHHRVKNNLQVVTSLLRLEGRRSSHAPTRAVLGDMQSRIRAMALLHEALYSSANLAQVDLATYLRRIVEQLVRAHATGPAQVTCRFDMQPIALTIDMAIPCGLIANELASNALKHGYADGRSGTLAVSLHRHGNRLRLQIADDGPGLPADFEARRGQSLGLQLVGDLARQLGASLDIGPAPQARFVLGFELPASPGASAPPLIAQVEIAHA